MNRQSRIRSATLAPKISRISTIAESPNPSRTQNNLTKQISRISTNTVSPTPSSTPNSHSAMVSPTSSSASTSRSTNTTETDSETVGKLNFKSVFPPPIDTSGLEPLTPFRDAESDDDDDYHVKTVDVFLLPVNYRLDAMQPLPFLVLGASLVTASLGISPWLNYSVLAEGLTFKDVFRQHVTTDLFKSCRTMRYKDDWQCFDITGMEGVQFMLLFNAFLSWCGFLIAVVQVGTLWAQETADDVTMNIPGVMMPYLVVSILTYLVVLQLTVTLWWFQYTDGGSASEGFFTCEMGVMVLFVGAILSWRVAFLPTQNPTPWKFDKIKDDENESDSEGSVVLDIGGLDSDQSTPAHPRSPSTVKQHSTTRKIKNKMMNSIMPYTTGYKSRKTLDATRASWL